MSEKVPFTTDSVTGRLLWNRYGNPEKTRNALKLKRIMQTCAAAENAFPWRITLEPGNSCILRCCPGGMGKTGLPVGFLAADDLDLFLSGLWPWLVQVNLFNWGEPLLNPQLPKIIKRIHTHGVGVQVHSNMNSLSKKMAETLPCSGLDVLVASIDGVTQNIYEQTRKGGDISTALHNLKTIVTLRNQIRDHKHMRIIWRYLCFPYNAHEIEQARQISQEIGVDEFTVGNGAWGGRVWTYENGMAALLQTNLISDPPYCSDIFDFPAVHWNGKVLPCCYAASEKFIWGDLGKQNWMEIVSGNAFSNARRVVCGDNTVSSPCSGCHRLGFLKPLKSKNGAT